MERNNEVVELVKRVKLNEVQQVHSSLLKPIPSHEDARLEKHKISIFWVIRQRLGKEFLSLAKHFLPQQEARVGIVPLRVSIVRGDEVAQVFFCQLHLVNGFVL